MTDLFLSEKIDLRLRLLMTILCLPHHPLTCNESDV